MSDNTGNDSESDLLLDEISSKNDELLEITDVDDIDALLDVMDVPDIDSIEVLDSANKAKIDDFTDDYVAPLLNVDFSDIKELNTPEKDVIEDEVEKANLSKISNNNEPDNADFDIDQLISEHSNDNTNDDALDIGDELLPEVSNEYVHEFDESKLKQLLNDEREEDQLKQNSEDSFTDFTDELVLDNLLTDDNSETQAIPEASEIKDIQELDSLDFDELLANIEEESMTSIDTDELDFDDVISDNIEEPLENIDSVVEEDLVSIDDLLSESADEDNDAEEPYNKTDIDVGLGEFTEFTQKGENINVDQDIQGIAANLDLAKVYLEIGELENAEIILTDIVQQGNTQQQNEAQQLLDNMK